MSLHSVRSSVNEQTLLLARWPNSTLHHHIDDLQELSFLLITPFLPISAWQNQRMPEGRTLGTFFSFLRTFSSTWSPDGTDRLEEAAMLMKTTVNFDMKRRNVIACRSELMQDKQLRLLGVEWHTG